MKRIFPILLLAISAACSSDTEEPAQRSTTAPVRSCEVTVSVEARSGDLAVAGDFSDWEPVQLERDGDRARADLGELEPGMYVWQLIVDSTPETRPPIDVETRWHDGTEYRKLEVKDCQRPMLRVDEPAAVNEGRLSARYRFVRSASDRPLDPDAVRVEVAGEPIPEASRMIDAQSGVIEIDHALGEHGKYSLQIWAADEDGTAAENDGEWTPLWYEADVFSWQDGLIYLIFTDRFRNSDGAVPERPTPEITEIASYRGGDFGGVEQAIREGYFDALGVNVLWLSPIYENPEAAFEGRADDLYTGYHGYWPIDSLSAESTYGGDEALASLVEAAHERGIRIMFDIVLNHVHEDHGYCQEQPEWCEKTCVCGTQDCDWEGPNGKPLICQFAPYLPDLNFRNGDLVERVLDDVLALVEKFDVDGLRIDAAKHMDHVIMRTLRSKTDAIERRGGAPFYLVGETFTNDRGLIMDYVGDHELHGQFDFPLFYAIRGAFAHDGSLRDLDAAARESQRVYGRATRWMSPFLGNHDIPRFATEAAGNDQGPFGNSPDLIAQGPINEVDQWDLINRLTLAFAFVLTQPGVPLVYYGDEVGLAGGPDPDNRRVMPTSLNANQLEVLARVQELGQMRADVDALRGDTRQQLWVDDSLYVYLRSNEAETAIVVINKSGEARAENVEIPSALGLGSSTFRAYRNPDLEFGVLDGRLRVQVEPWSYQVLLVDSP